jgi:peptidoglycan/xylan/chitin deacetylase (PgdA/CDA1 family)
LTLSGISNKREYLARTLERLGWVKLLEHVVATTRPALVVLTYHRIAERDTDLFYDPVISAAPQSFRMQIDWLRKHMRILTLLELDNRIRAVGPWDEPAAFITFDDGYRDNFDTAVPILNELNVPATFFIPTEFLQSPKLPWWDHIAYVINKTPVHRLLLNCNPNDNRLPLVVELESTSRRAVIMTIIRAVLAGRIADLPWFLEHLTAQAEMRVESECLGESLFMSWEQMRQLTDTAGRLTVGSHAHSHRVLAKLDETALEHELVHSKYILQERLGLEVSALAYPFGWSGTYNQTTKTSAMKAGYRLAFASQSGVNHPGKLDPFEIRRLGIGASDSLTILRARTALFSAFGRSFL